MPAQSTLRSSKRVKMVHPGLLPQQMMGMMGMPMMAGGMHPAALQQQQAAAMAAMNPALSAAVHNDGLSNLFSNSFHCITEEENDSCCDVTPALVTPALLKHAFVTIATTASSNSGGTMLLLSLLHSVVL